MPSDQPSIIRLPGRRAARAALLVIWAALAASATAGFCAPARAEEVGYKLTEPYSVEVSDVTARVGERAVMRITLHLRDGFRVLEAYTNRVSRFSSLDGGVAFADKIVNGTADNNTLVFAVPVTPTAPGRHPINGVFRVGYIEGGDQMVMVSVPLVAAVIGQE